MEKFEISGIKDFNPVHIFDCGQCFRWNANLDGSYTGVAKGCIVKVRFDKISETLAIENCNESDFNEIWFDYFDLGRDYSDVKCSLSENDPVMKKAADYGYGIRILKQDLWECIVSFVISQNNNIPRIKGCIERLCKAFGNEIENPFAGAASQEKVYDIPAAEKLAELCPEDLAEIRLGYRAKYIIDTARAVTEKGLPKNYEELLALNGVGPKVANCIELFGMGKFDSFPIDVWVRRLMHKLYGIDENDKKAMHEYAKIHFGELAGIAQQYLFYYIREDSVN